MSNANDSFIRLVLLDAFLYVIMIIFCAFGKFDDAGIFSYFARLFLTVKILLFLIGKKAK